MLAAVENMEQAFLPLLLFVRLLIEAAATLWIIVGVAYAFGAMVSAHVHHHTDMFRAIRLRFSRYLSLALEFQLAADILSTAIAPSFDELGKLAIIAVIRTALNYFLSKEMQEEREEATHQAEVAAPVRASDAAFRPITPPVVRA